MPDDTSITPFPTADATGAHWLPWSDDAFALASARRLPVLLTVIVRWSAADDQLAAVLTDPALAVLVVGRVVPVRVDADERPDVACRYGGAPTVALLTSDGDVIASATAPFARVPEAVSLMIEDGLRAWETDPEAVRATADAERETRRAARVANFTRRDGVLSPAVLDAALEAIRDVPGASLQPDEIRLLRYAHLRRGGLAARTRAREGATAWLTALANPPAEAPVLADAYGAALLAIAELARDDRDLAEEWRESAELAVAHLDALTDSLGAIRFARPPDGAPIFADACAQAARGLIEAGVAWARRDWTALGLRAVDFLAERMLAGEAGSYHAWDGVPRTLGLLRDQGAVLLAMLAAYEVSGRGWYLERVRSLGRVVEREWREPGQGFWDTAARHEEIGLLAEPRMTMAENVTVAEAFLWLSRLTHEQHGYDVAYASLRSFASTPDAGSAAYARVVDRVLSLEPEIKVVAEWPAGEPDRVADPLTQVALRLPIAARTVQRLSVATDEPLLRALGLPVDVSRVAYVCTAQSCSAPVTDADALERIVTSMLAIPLDDLDDSNDDSDDDSVDDGNADGADHRDRFAPRSAVRP